MRPFARLSGLSLEGLVSVGTWPPPKGEKPTPSPLLSFCSHTPQHAGESPQRLLYKTRATILSASQGQRECRGVSQARCRHAVGARDAAARFVCPWTCLAPSSPLPSTRSPSQPAAHCPGAPRHGPDGARRCDLAEIPP